jgi:hypothetical protein
VAGSTADLPLFRTDITQIIRSQGRSRAPQTVQVAVPDGNGEVAVTVAVRDSFAGGGPAATVSAPSSAATDSRGCVCG